jgi:hypothetical protein
MTTSADDLLIAFELHSVDGIRAILESGFDVRAPINGKAPVNLLLEMYTRSDRFPECLRVLIDHGAELDDLATAPVLLDDVEMLRSAIDQDPDLVQRQVRMVSPFTSLDGVPLLHVAAEYGHIECARLLLEMGAPVDARASADGWGMNGHTALFHTVNSHANRSEPMMRLLLDAGAKADILVPGVNWGKSFAWETVFFDVTPIAYAQLGVVPQMHRDERDVQANVKTLLQAAGRKVPPLENVPNRYLHPR